jgi:hypothetical protein
MISDNGFFINFPLRKASGHKRFTMIALPLTRIILPVILFTAISIQALKAQDNDDSDEDIVSIFIVKLKPGIPAINAVINDTATFKLKACEKALYDSETGMLYIADGRYGKIPAEDLQNTDTAYFRFTYSRTNFLLRKGEALFDAAQAENVNINKIMLKARLHDKTAMTNFFETGFNLDDADATAQFATYFWAMLNTWSDKELLGWLNTLTNDQKEDFSNYISDGGNTYPIENPEVYLKLYYPESWKVINAGL